ncbi:MAG TPA: fructosamine kinase family protein [Nitrococcus sp.]|nr:fructosamine kinase family protein [Nitrococcus sp.]
MSLWDDIGAAVERTTGLPLAARLPRSISGGSINRAMSVGEGDRRYFVKLNEAPGSLAMFEAETAGLRLLAQPGVLRVPRPICLGMSGAVAYLVLEHITFGRGGAAGDERLGTGLAAIHQVTGPHFGWDRDNTIGSTPQVNQPTDDWVTFYRDHRLSFQLELAERNGYSGSLTETGARLLERLPALCAGHHPVASLLHGDLWGGNAAFDRDGAPVIYDPAVYFGDRETDLAMTELFGGFGVRFYRAYQAAWPLDEGYELRRDLYQLYHVLNHLNLFGAGYARNAQRLIDRLLVAVC